MSYLGLKSKRTVSVRFFFACVELSKLLRIWAVNVHFMLAEQSSQQ